jgi:signal transduction histidine kinase
VYSDYLNQSLQVLNVVIFTMGAFFVIMHLSGRFHKDFLPRGVWILLGAVFTAVDLFVLPELITPLAVTRWTAFQHALFAWVGLAILWDVTWLLKWPQPKLMLGVLLSNCFFSVFVFWPGFLEVPLTAGLHPAGGTLYLWGGIYLLAVGLLPLPFLARRMISPVARADRHSVVTFAVGYSLVLLLGLMDWADVKGWIPFASVPYTLFGFLCVTALGGISLIRRLLAMHTTLIDTLEALKIAYQELDESRSLSKLGELTSRISHDIANYCTTLSGQAYYLSKCFEVPEAQRSLGTITTTTERLTTLAREVMALASGGVSAQREPMDLQQLLQEVMRGENFTDRARFQLHWATTQCHILGEWHKMERVFMNLFQNAVDARRPSQALAEIQVSAEERQGHFVITVADHGIGLEDVQCAHIFEPFISYQRKHGHRLRFGDCSDDC